METVIEQFDPMINPPAEMSDAEFNRLADAVQRQVYGGRT